MDQFLLKNQRIIKYYSENYSDVTLSEDEYLISDSDTETEIDTPCTDSDSHNEVMSYSIFFNNKYTI